MNKSKKVKNKITFEDTKKELLSGQYEKGGAITIIMDMSVTDEENWQVQHGLLMHRRFDNPFFARCNETEKPLNNPAVCYMCGKLYNSNVLGVNKATRFPDWGFETGAELIMDILIREEEHQLSQMMNNMSFERKYQEGFQMLTSRLTGLRKSLESKEPNKGMESLTNPETSI